MWSDHDLKNVELRLRTDFPRTTLGRIVDAISAAADSKQPSDGVDGLAERAAVLLMAANEK